MNIIDEMVNGMRLDMIVNMRWEMIRRVGAKTPF